MENERKLMSFYFITNEETSVHYHQNLEILYLMRGRLDIKIDESVYQLHAGDFILINANKSHSCVGMSDILAARFQINFHMLAECMGTLQLMFWCNTAADKNDAYDDVRRLLDKILDRYFEKDDKGALYLNALYYELMYLLTSNFMVKADDVRINLENSQDRIRIQQIQNYIQANYQTQISLNDLAERLYLSNAYLSKYIKKHLGLTFLEYLNNVRLFHAVDELMYTSKSITHIALDNGFPTSAAFTKAFRDIHGEAPSEYRKKVQKSQQPFNQGQVLETKSLRLVKEYLKFRQNPEAENNKRTQECVVDMGQCEQKNVVWNKAVNVGEAYTLLQSEAQNQLKEIQRETGMVYARIWNLLSREHCFDEKEGINFRKLDLVLDFIIDNHMKPYIELGQKPEIFLYTHERMLMGNIKDRDLFNYETFCDVIKAFCLHLINRYGLEELESWYFEYWNDPELEMTKEDGDYYRYFEVIYRTFKDIAPEIRIGGAGFILGYENHVCRDIFRIWKNRQVQPDFLSFCSFQYIALVEGERVYGRRSIDGNYMKNQVELIREIMKEEAFYIPELHIDEWNFTVSNRNVFNDSCEQGAYILKTCISMLGCVDFMAYWHGLDIYSEYYDSGAILNGDSGMISRDGIRKPSFYAFQFIDKLQNNVIRRDENSIITSNGRGHFTIACHNYKKLSSKYVFCEEDEIQIDDMDQFVEDIEPLDLKFRLENVKNGTYQLKIHYLNKENGSAQDIWKKMEYGKVLSKDEIEYMKRRAIPSLEIQTVQVNDGVLELENTLLSQEIRLLDIQYRYAL